MKNGAHFATFVRNRRNVSFVELRREFESVYGEGSARGDLSIEIFPNVILWVGCSQAFAELIEVLRDSCELSPCHFLVYLADGGVPSLPVAKRPTAKGYKSPRWLPVVLNPRTKARAAK